MCKLHACPAPAHELLDTNPRPESSRLPRPGKRISSSSLPGSRHPLIRNTGNARPRSARAELGREPGLSHRCDSTWHVEYFGIFSSGKNEEYERHFISPGVHYLINPNLEVGARVGWGLNDKSARFFTNVGFGWRF